MSLRENLLSALISDPVRWVNFEHRNRLISPICFYMLWRYVNDGKVSTKIDRSIQGRTAFYDPSSNTIIASDPTFGSNYWDEKALLIHESAHAILDILYVGRNMQGKKDPMRVVDDEIIGYLAQAFYLVSANADNFSKGAPEREAIKVAKIKLPNPRPPWTGTLTFRFTAQELQPLRNAIITSPLYRNNANAISTHDG
jgi:hypothetical protein